MANEGDHRLERELRNRQMEMANNEAPTSVEAAANEIAQSIVLGCEMNYGFLVAEAKAWLLKWIAEAIIQERTAEQIGDHALHARAADYQRALKAIRVSDHAETCARWKSAPRHPLERPTIDADCTCHVSIATEALSPQGEKVR